MNHTHQTYDPTCPGCRPAMMDYKTGQVFAPDHPTMVIVNRVYDAASYAEQEAFFEVCVKNSQKPQDRELAMGLMNRIQKAILAQ